MSRKFQAPVPFKTGGSQAQTGKEPETKGSEGERNGQPKAAETGSLLGKRLVPPIRIERTTRGLGKLFDVPIPAYSGSFEPVSSMV